MNLSSLSFIEIRDLIYENIRAQVLLCSPKLNRKSTTTSNSFTFMHAPKTNHRNTVILYIIEHKLVSPKKIINTHK